MDILIQDLGKAIFGKANPWRVLVTTHVGSSVTDGKHIIQSTAILIYVYHLVHVRVRSSNILSQRDK